MKLLMKKAKNILKKAKTLSDYEADDGPLTNEFMEFLRKKAAESCPKGKLISKVSLFDIDFDKIKKPR